VGLALPFLLSLALVGVGLYVRLGIVETPVFARLAADRRIERAPVAEVFRRHTREIVLTALCRMAEQAPFYIFTAFVFAYGADTLHVDRNFLLTAFSRHPPCRSS
jgi:hypothetical protein